MRDSKNKERGREEGEGMKERKEGKKFEMNNFMFIC